MLHGSLIIGYFNLFLRLQINHVLVIAGVNSQRFDHIMGQLNTLHRATDYIPKPLILMNGFSLLWMLSPGNHKISIPEHIRNGPSSSWCGLIPVGNPSVVSTTGLKWNLGKFNETFY